MEIPQIKLFFMPKSKSYYYISLEDIYCDNCNGLITDNFILNHSWGRRFYEQKSCLDCYKKIKKKGRVEEYKLCIYSRQPQEGLIPIFIQPPALINAGHTVFSIMEQKTDAMIKDNAIISKIQHRINEQNFQKIDKEKYKYLDRKVKDIDVFFEGIKESRLVNYEGNEILEIEDGTNH